MKPIRTILVPVDFSSHSRRALELGLQLAGCFQAQLDVLHVGMRASVYAPLDRWIWGEDRHHADLERAVQEAAAKAFEEFLSELPQEQRSQVGERLEMGVPSDVIIRVAKEDGYGMIVLGSHGRTGARHVLLGSVASRVAHHAHCPVTTVR